MRISESDYKAIRTKQVAKLPKFGNKKTEVDGILFDSKKEATRYHELKLMLRAGLVRDLSLQVPYRIEIDGVLICKYIADFQYELHTPGQYVSWTLIVEDVKGYKTDIYRSRKS